MHIMMVMMERGRRGGARRPRTAAKAGRPLPPVSRPPPPPAGWGSLANPASIARAAGCTDDGAGGGA
eukprot:gene6290-60116_t